MADNDSRGTKLFGLSLAAVGLSHLAAPKFWEPLTTAAFPDNTRSHIYTNGGIETALGLGLAARPTRKLAVVGMVGYLVYLAGNVVRNR